MRHWQPPLVAACTMAVVLAAPTAFGQTGGPSPGSPSTRPMSPGTVPTPSPTQPSLGPSAGPSGSTAAPSTSTDTGKATGASPSGNDGGTKGSKMSKANGQVGADVVRNAQKALQDKGVDPGPVDGVMGPRTQAALRSFQKDQNLPPTGRLDPQTREKLGVSVQ